MIYILYYLRSVARFIVGDEVYNLIVEFYTDTYQGFYSSNSIEEAWHKSGAFVTYMKLIRALVVSVLIPLIKHVVILTIAFVVLSFLVKQLLRLRMKQSGRGVCIYVQYGVPDRDEWDLRWSLMRAESDSRDIHIYTSDPVSWMKKYPEMKTLPLSFYKLPRISRIFPRDKIYSVDLMVDMCTAISLLSGQIGQRFVDGDGDRYLLAYTYHKFTDTPCVGIATGWNHNFRERARIKLSNFPWVLHYKLASAIASICSGGYKSGYIVDSNETRKDILRMTWEPNIQASILTSPFTICDVWQKYLFSSEERVMEHLTRPLRKYLSAVRPAGNSIDEVMRMYTRGASKPSSLRVIANDMTPLRMLKVVNTYPSISHDIYVSSGAVEEYNNLEFTDTVNILSNDEYEKTVSQYGEQSGETLSTDGSVQWFVDPPVSLVNQLVLSSDVYLNVDEKATWSPYLMKSMANGLLIVVPRNHHLINDIMYYKGSSLSPNPEYRKAEMILKTIKRALSKSLGEKPPHAKAVSDLEPELLTESTEGAADKVALCRCQAMIYALRNVQTEKEQINTIKRLMNSFWY